MSTNKIGFVANKYEFIYFPVKGRGVYIRYLMKDNNIDYTETIVMGETWGSMKPTTPFGQIPILKDGGLEIAQSSAILRYLGNKHGLCPSGNAADCAKLDMTNDHVEDVRKAYADLIYKNYDIGTCKADFIAGLPDKLKPLENLLNKWDNDYILSTISWADYNLFDLLDILQVLSKDCLSGMSKLQAYYDRISARPAIKAYRETEEFKNMRINGNTNQ